MADFLMAFGCVAPFLPTVFEQWGPRNIQAMQILVSKSTQRGQRRISGEAGQAPEISGSLSGDS